MIQLESEIIGEREREWKRFCYNTGVLLLRGGPWLIMMYGPVNYVCYKHIFYCTVHIKSYFLIEKKIYAGINISCNKM